MGMIGKKTLQTDPTPFCQAKELLEERATIQEPSYEQNLALDHVIKFSKISVESAQKMIAELEEIIKTNQAVKMADIMPEDMADMRLMFAKERGSHKKEDLDKILDIINKYRE
jgi:DNA-directed RNA polymerase subunit F